MYANAAYTYDNKYTLNASLRMDQSNLFGSNPANQYKPIWSVGGAWQIAKEEFMSNCDFFNQLTLRASFGYAGNSPDPGTGGTYDILKASSSTRFETPVYKVDTPANDMLTWEKTRIVNIGFDTQFWKNAISLSFDYYDKYTTDLISTVTLNPTTGFFSALGNIGELSNKGFEFTLTTNNFRREKFAWQTMLTFSYNKNKVEKVVRETPIEYADQLAGTMTALEGYPMYSLFSYRYAGLTNEGMCAAYDKDGNIVDKTEYSIQCEKHSCEIIGDKYFDKNGNIVDKTEYSIQCEKHSCEIIGDKYFDKNGNIITKNEYTLQCEKHSCEIINGVYFGKEGTSVTDIEYDKQCNKHYCKIIDGTYFGKNGDIISKADFNIQCPTDNPHTDGSDILGYFLIGLLITTFVSIIACYKQNNKKVYKI